MVLVLAFIGPEAGLRALLHSNRSFVGPELARFIYNATVLAAVYLYAESIGPGPETRIATGTVSKTATGPGSTANEVYYYYDFTVRANRLPESNPTGNDNAPSGVYKLICTCFLNSNLPGAGQDISGYVEGPIIRIENPR